MSLTVSEPLRGRALFDRIWKFTLRRVVLPIVVWGPIAYVFPKIALFYLACGIYDVSRNRPLGNRPGAIERQIKKMKILFAAADLERAGFRFAPADESFDFLHGFDVGLAGMLPPRILKRIA